MKGGRAFWAGLIAWGFMGCAGSDESMITATDGTATDGNGSTTDDDPTFDPSTPSTTAPDPSTTTGDESTTGVGGTGSTGGDTDGGTGCTPGEEGCSCSNGESACNGALECIDDVCVAPVCETRDDEPNDDFTDPTDLGELNDDDGPVNHVSQLAGTDDVDWFTYHCVDTITGDVDPGLIIDQTDDIRVCMFLDCDEGGNPLFECPEGTVSEEAPFDFLPGCCVTDGSSFNLGEYNCPDSSDDSVSAWIRVDDPAENVCVAYSFTYQC